MGKSQHGLRGTPTKDMILVIWDQYAKYPVAEFVTTTSAETTIRALQRIFTTYGTPKELKTDNGPPFNGAKFSEFAKVQGFKHRKVTPKWAEANGDVERIIQIIKKSARIAKIEGKNIQQEIQRTIRSYRDTPHGNTGESPNKLIFGRELNGRLPPRMTRKTVPADKETQLPNKSARPMQIAGDIRKRYISKLETKY